MNTQKLLATLLTLSKLDEADQARLLKASLTTTEGEFLTADAFDFDNDRGTVDNTVRWKINQDTDQLEIETRYDPYIYF